jgi:hypothetical protein
MKRNDNMKSRRFRAIWARIKQYAPVVALFVIVLAICAVPSLLLCKVWGWTPAQAAQIFRLVAAVVLFLIFVRLLYDDEPKPQKEKSKPEPVNTEHPLARGHPPDD